MHRLDMHTVQNILLYRKKKGKINSKDVLICCEIKWRANIWTSIRSIMTILIFKKFPLQNTLINFSDLLQVELGKKNVNFFSSFTKPKLFVNNSINNLQSKKQFFTVTKH